MAARKSFGTTTKARKSSTHLLRWVLLLHMCLLKSARKKVDVRINRFVLLVYL